MRREIFMCFATILNCWLGILKVALSEVSSISDKLRPTAPHRTGHSKGFIVWHLPISNRFDVCRAASRGERSRSHTKASNQDQSDGKCQIGYLGIESHRAPRCGGSRFRAIIWRGIYPSMRGFRFSVSWPNAIDDCGDSDIRFLFYIILLLSNNST